MRGLTCIGILCLSVAGCEGGALPIGTNDPITAAHCRDGVLGNDEVDVDCGGADCARCEAGRSCGHNEDCQTGACDNGVCVHPCGGPCDFANGVGRCNDGTCVLVSCNQGFADCDHHDANGCEADIDGDFLNCGACGQPCNAACVHGVCGGGQGCGGLLCNFANGAGRCVNNACELVSCNNGFGDCDGSPHNGCEGNLTTDASNCGACGNVCQHGQVCVAGVCGMANGGCNFVCLPPHGTGLCLNGACTIGGCDAGFADCDRGVDDGCEVKVDSDPLNCGACGTACQHGKACVHGACQ